MNKRISTLIIQTCRPLAVHLSVAELENNSRSENITWGMRTGAEEGRNKMYNKVCYGYKSDKEGNLVIKEDEKENVRLIFRLYLDGHSVISIIKELKMRRIESPSGKDKWNKRCIEKMLRNQKYTGDSTIMTGGGTYLKSGNHPAIIERSVFNYCPATGKCVATSLSVMTEQSPVRVRNIVKRQFCVRQLSLNK